MLSIKYQIKTSLNNNGQQYDLDEILQLLGQIQKSGNLREAANRCSFSYRKAWNLLKQSEQWLGNPLVNKQRGKGTQLSAMGSFLLNSTHDTQMDLKQSLMQTENKVNSRFHSQFSTLQPLRIIASDSEKIERLREQCHDIELSIDGSQQALLAYLKGECELAGFHIGLAANKQERIEEYCQYFDQNQDQFIVLEQRLQGLISHPEQAVNSFHQILSQQLTFVNRQQGSGTRVLLDSLLKQQNIKPEQLMGYYHEEHTHLAIASLVSSRQADVGLGIQSAAIRLKLHFMPVSHELYFLVFKSLSPQVQHILDILSAHSSFEILNYQEFAAHLAHSLPLEDNH